MATTSGTTSSRWLTIHRPISSPEPWRSLRGPRRTCRSSISTFAASRSPGSRSTAPPQGSHVMVKSWSSLPPGCTCREAVLATVGYQGTPTVVTDPDGSIEGWVPTDDGAVSVGEPQGSPGWFPCNDNPQDKATFDFAITVPAGLTAMANGVLVSNARVATRRRGCGVRPTQWPRTLPLPTSAAST